MNMHTSPRALMSAVAGPAAAASEATQTPAELVKAMNEAWTAFQAKNDERLKQVEKRGEDAVTRAEVENLNAELTKIQGAIDANIKAVGRLTVGGSGSGAGDTDIKAAAKFFATAQRRRIAPGETVDVEAYASYKAAFDEFIRSEANPDMLKPDVRAALSVGSDRDGGQFVPTETSNELERRIFDTSPMRQVARVITIGAPAWEAPFKSSKGVSGGWVGERSSRPASGTGTVGMQRIETHEQYAYPEVTQNMLDDATLNVESFLLEDTEEEMVRQENTAFVSGDGVMKPKGFLTYKDAAVTTDDDTRNWGVLQYVPTGAAGAFPDASGIAGAKDPDSLIDIITKLNPGYRQGAAWAMNRNTEAEIRKLKDADGRYFVGMGSIEGNLSFNLFGYPIVNMEDMPDLASDSFSVGFGNWSRGYYIVDRAGFRVLRDPYTNKPYVGFYITKRTGGDVRNFDSIKLLKAGTS